MLRMRGRCACLLLLAACSEVPTNREAPSVSLAVSPRRIVLGQSAILTWSSNATSCWGSVSPAPGSGGWGGTLAAGSGAGSGVTPTSTGSYAFTLTCTAAGVPASASTQLTVDPVPPTASLEASAATAFVGDSILLTWSSTGATACEAGGTWRGMKPTSGSETVVAATPGELAYTLSCRGPVDTTVVSLTIRASPASLPLTNLFTPNALTIATSEGGPHGEADIWDAQVYLPSAWGYGPAKVMRVYVCLSGMVESCSQATPPSGPLSPEMLNAISAGIARFAHSGARLLIRFIYNFGPFGAPDVPVSLIALHIDQLAPILLQHQDLIFGLEAGFIGTWGEWHHSTNFNDTPEVRKTVLDRELFYFRNHFPLLVRYPADLLAYTGTATPWPELGLHDDFYASNADDGNTWTPRDGWLEADLKSYAAAVATSSMFAGEFGALDPLRQDCDELERYSFALHPQTFSLDIWPVEVGQSLASRGCALSFLNRVGTRIEVRSVTLSGDAIPGGKLHVVLTLANAGFGRVMRPRPTMLVLSAGDSVLQRTTLPLTALDLRSLASTANPVPGVFQFDLTLPEVLPDKVLSLSLLIPDPAPSLVSEPAYALPLNSLDSAGHPVFAAATGYNLLASFAPRGVLVAPSFIARSTGRQR